jgi:5-methylcytosine-specific restriction protein B
MQKSAAVREYVRREYIEPARRRGQSRVTVVAGDVHKGAQLKNLVPLVCQALGGKKILQENHMTLEKRESPAASGQSTTVAFTYRLDPADGKQPPAKQVPNFVTMRGIGKEVFASLGGGEAFIRKERESFYGDERDR